MNTALQQSLHNLANWLYQICYRDEAITTQIQREAKQKYEQQYIVFEWLSKEEDQTELILAQQHITIQSIKNDPQSYELLTLEMILYLTELNSQGTIHYTNFGTTILDFKILASEQVKEMTIRLIDRLYFPCNKIFFHIECFINENKDYNIVQFSDTKYVIQRMEPSMKQQICEMANYNKFTIQLASQAFHQQHQFLNTLKHSIQLVIDSQISRKIKEQLHIHNISQHEIYISSLIMNIAKQINDNVTKIISLVQCYLNKLKDKENRTDIIIQKQRFKDLESIFQQQTYIFQELRNCHFPKKQNNSQKYIFVSYLRCKVCQKLNSKKIRKSNYKCLSCSEIYGINVTLCTQCFKKFHTNPQYFLTRKQRIKIKIENKSEL